MLFDKLFTASKHTQTDVDIFLDSSYAFDTFDNNILFNLLSILH